MFFFFGKSTQEKTVYKVVKARLVKTSFSDPQLQVYLLKPYIVLMCIMEIHEMDVSPISKKKNLKKSKQTKTKTFVFVVVLTRAISTKCCFKIFLKFSYEEE